jgi:hypothetical protein
MELVAEYRQIDEPRRVNLLYPEFRPEWELFHNSTEQKISVFAGRQMGKTYNLALRAVRSQYDCIIFVQHSINVIIMRDLIQQMSEALPIVRSTREREHALIEYAGGRTIDIHVMPRNYNSLRGRRLTMKEVMFDEFENSSFSGFLEAMRFELHRAAHIVCAGSMTTPYDSPAKRWFESSHTRYYLDVPYPPVEAGQGMYVEHEFFPSRMRGLIEQLPPFDYAY